MRPSEALAAHRDVIRQVVLANRASNPRIFGSVAKGEDTEGSDLDLLVDGTEDMSLFDLARIEIRLSEILGVPVEVRTPFEISSRYRDAVLSEARPL
jgi:predicted nucleotidyltransferase